MKVCARSRYSNEFGPVRVGKTHLVGMSFVSFMNKRFAGAWHIACTIKLVERGVFLRRERCTAGIQQGLYITTLLERDALMTLVWRVLSKRLSSECANDDMGSQST
jgi:hypothetical protein